MKQGIYIYIMYRGCPCLSPTSLDTATIFKLPFARYYYCIKYCSTKDNWWHNNPYMEEDIPITWHGSIIEATPSIGREEFWLQAPKLSVLIYRLVVTREHHGKHLYQYIKTLICGACDQNSSLPTAGFPQ